MKTLLRSRLVLTTTMLALIGVITYACKDFLDTKAQGTLDENALANRDGVEGSLIATYRMLDCNNVTSANWGCAASNWALSSITSDDAYKGSEDFDQPQATELELYAWDTDQGMDYLNAKWNIVYEGVVRANATLRLLAQIVATKPGELTAAEASSIEGEALFLRAHYHFEAWRVWGNIPYYYQDDTDFRKANDLGIDGVGNAILADLDAAIAKLPDVPRDKGRAGAWTAKAYKGRVLMYMHQYANAITVLQDVKTNGPYALETSFDHVWTGFPALQNGPETIFAFMASANDGEPNGQNSNWGERLNFPHSGSPFGCCGFHQPSQNLANVYQTDAVTGLPLAYTSPATWNNRDAEWSASAADVVDPRMDWTIGRDDVPFKDWGLHSSLWIRSLSYGGPYSPKKNIHEKASPAQNHVGWQPEQTNAVHLHLFRYADLLLLLAEAQVEQNDLPGALANVNLVRARAGVTAQGCGSSDAATVAKYPQCAADSRLAVPINDASITWATYRVGLYPSFPNQGQARLAVQLERRLELAMEGQRLFDLRRYGGTVAQQTMADYLSKEATSLRRSYKSAQTPYTTPRYDLYPIPTVQIDLSKVGGENRLTQNPGW
ncbi:MAG TPA: RagB/SusD family nutrient uptake outer membrane protein [Gemmatimonadales bacterium]|nr:RagB/SusD family nutrient uptake outer membrane protein [Gemmatimonadales bacterium]